MGLLDMLLIFAGMFVFLIIGIIAMSVGQGAHNEKFNKEQEERNEKIRQERQKRIEAKNNVEFYRECLRRGYVENGTGKANIELMQAIARAENISYNDALNRFNVGKATYLKSIKDEDMKIYSNAKERSKLVGKDKYLLGFREKLEELNRQSGAYKDISELTGRNRNYKAQTTSWGIAGGIASAIGGPGAGVATALEVQRENAEAERAAESIRKNAAETSSYFSYESIKKESEANSIANAINSVSKRLIDTEKKEEKYGFLKQESSGITIQPTGDLHVKVTLKVLKDIKIYNNPGLLDGSLRVKVLDSSKNEIAEGYLCPEGFGSGISYYKEAGFGYKANQTISFTAVCLTHPDKKAEKGVVYTVDLKPINMWIIER